MTLSEFEIQLAQEAELDPEYKLTKEAKMEFMEELIRKELLLQEAKKMKLDRREKFMQAIERYWESTLIRDLIDVKSSEISKKVYITEKEIHDYYDQHHQGLEADHLTQEMKAQIKQTLKDQKKSQLLKEWIEMVRKNAYIEIESKLL